MKKFLLIIISIISILHAQTTFFRTYGLGIYDVGESVVVNSDTTYVIGGITDSGSGTGTDFLLFKTNSVGDVLWRKQFGGAGPDGGKAVISALDNGGYLITGYQNNFDSSGYNVWLIKTDTNGNMVWSKSYGGLDWDFANSITTLADSTYVIAGETYSFGNGQRDVYLIRFDSNGDTLWTKTYGGPDDDVAKYIFTDRNNNLVVIGNTKSYGAGNSDVYVLHLDTNGDTLWTKTIGTPEDDFGYSAIMYVDSALNEMDYVIGYSSYYVPESGNNMYLARIDSVVGNIQATYPIGEISVVLLDRPHLIETKTSHFAYFTDYREAYYQNCIMFSQSYLYNFVQGPPRTYAGGGNENTSQNSVKRALDKGFVVTGLSENWGPGQSSAFLLKTDSLFIVVDTPTIGIENLIDNEISVFPNPVEGNHFYINSGSCIEKVQIFNRNGQLMAALSTGKQEKSITVEKPPVTSGLYIVQITTTAGTVRRKIIF